MSAKNPEPEFITTWRHWYSVGPPKCCHTCSNYMDDGECSEFKLSPPKEFTDTIEQCDKWDMELPF